MLNVDYTSKKRIDEAVVIKSILKCKEPTSLHMRKKLWNKKEKNNNIIGNIRKMQILPKSRIKEKYYCCFKTKIQYINYF